MDVLVSNDRFRIERLELGPWATNCYLLHCVKTGQCAVVDVPPDLPAISAQLGKRRPEFVLLTHNHIDHTAGLSAFKGQYPVPLAAHRLDLAGLPARPEKLIEDGDELDLGDLKIRALHTPGHTPGSLCFLLGDHLIAGDTLFPGGPGRTASPTDFAQILLSIREKILSLGDATRVYPGHGAATTVDEARREYAYFASLPHRPDLCGDVEWRAS